MKSKILALAVLIGGMGWIHYLMGRLDDEPPPAPSPPSLSATLEVTLGTLTFTTQLLLGEEVSVNYDQQGVTFAVKPLGHTPAGWRYQIANGAKDAPARIREAVLWNQEKVIEETGFKLHYRPSAPARQAPDGNPLVPQP